MTFTLAPHVSSVRTPGGMVLLNARTGRYWQMNDTGAFVLEHLLAGGTTASAADELRNRHPSAAHRVAADAVALLESLQSAKLVTW
ncbi:lasso peptide biosynthesis PqqD family chaperone [Streptomyces albofaciens JCM 4342]|uniref:lasso peptide biosynthesis PqqD family chaperone n=1 Tax=Streptomyces albofaciens TaxID=66866 RepID=UPI00123A1102|nr:lasso peptide biosynthesis PqqD family chaperone [Streptomyces albofaciens]KAA6221588.1 lasso peptide biosynthesis PqqD family chaperone [Streptomyces albofaciens JCM 4342]